MKHLVIACLLVLAACSTPEIEASVEVVTIKSEPIARPALVLPSVDTIRPRSVEWVVVTPDNVDRIFAEMEAKGQAPALFGLTETGYKNVAVNTQESLRVILQQKAVIAGYRAYYLKADNTIVDFNQSLQ